MTNHSSTKTVKNQQEMFSRIAIRYDLMNHLMTGWQDDRWRKYVIRQSSLPSNGILLDLGTGTGKLAQAALTQYPQSQVAAVDITLPMMIVGRQKHDHPGLHWSAAAAEKLPFEDNAFDAVVSGFLIRNLNHLNSGLKEQYRVLKPGGKIISLDTSRTPQTLFTPFIRIYLHHVIPLLGQIITGNRRAYSYLPDSTANFLRAEELAAHLAAAGFQKVNYRTFMFGMIAVHWGEK